MLYTPLTQSCQANNVYQYALYHYQYRHYCVLPPDARYTKRRNYDYNRGIIYLTRSWLLPLLKLCDLGAQLQQVIDPKPRAPAGGLRKQIRPHDTGPSGEHRA